MKKILALILAAIMLLALASCGNQNTDDSTDDNKVSNSDVIAPTIDKNTWGYALWEAFEASVKSGKDLSPDKIVTDILATDAGKAIAMCDKMSVSEGAIQGFDADIKGFKSATMFAPAAAGYAFIGYVFELEANTDAAEFIKKLNDNHNLRWMVCMTAEMATSGAYGNYVLFVMSPAKISG